MSHINPSWFTNIIFKSVTRSIQQFTDVLFYLSLKVFYRGQIPNHQRDYEGILDLSKEIVLNDFNGPFLTAKFHNFSTL